MYDVSSYANLSTFSSHARVFSTKKNPPVIVANKEQIKHLVFKLHVYRLPHEMKKTSRFSEREQRLKNVTFEKGISIE